MTTLHLPLTGTILRLRESWSYRLQQAVAFALPQRPPTIPADMAMHLRPGTLERFRDLTAADQRHLLAVGRLLRADGAVQDLWMAGLLHDIGKTHHGKHVRLLDRGLWVIASRVPPIAGHVGQRPAMPRVGSGLWIAAHHAELGYAKLRDLGYSERICTLVAFHEDDNLAQLDPELAQLRTADDTRLSVPSRAIARPSVHDEAYGHAD